MKRLLPLLLICLLLCGCGQPSLPEEPAAVTEGISVVPTTGPEGLYDPESDWEAATNGAVRAYPLPLDAVRGMLAFGDGILVFSGDSTTTLTLLTGKNLQITATAVLGIALDCSDPSLRIGSNTLSYCDSVSRETVVLDTALNVIHRIALPAELTGTPILSADRRTLYYCTAKAVKAWDLESGIRRTIKEMAYEGQTAAELLMDDTILQCSAAGKSLFLSTETGQLLGELDTYAAIDTADNRFYASFPHGLLHVQVFGDSGQRQLLLPAEYGTDCTFLPENQAAVTVSAAEEGSIQLDYYALDTGLRRSVLTLKAADTPEHILCKNGDVYFLMRNTICRWDPNQTNVNDGNDYTSLYDSAEDPDHDALSLCQAYADEIAATHGIEILVGEAAAAIQPWDYDLKAEILPGLIWRELTVLEQRLTQYPEGMLAETASPFRGLKICLVQSITGTTDTGSLSTATGVQYLEDTDACIAIAVGPFSEQALYHELFHVMETHIFNESIAFDQWDALNPAGFSYDYDYASNALRDSGIYLTGETRAFVDTYSMSYPKEDRARIMEYAMLPGNDALFASEIMQAKLTAICKGIREAFGLEKHEEAFLWEQYLEKSLAFPK